MKVLKVFENKLRGVFKNYKKYEHPNFVKPKITFYFGLAQNGTPYFYPRNWVSTVIKISSTKPFADGNVRRFKQYSRAWKTFRFAFLNRWWCIQIGTPIVLERLELGWKEKYGTPRFEWSPSIQLYFFMFEFSMFLKIEERYWEQLLWVKYFCDGDVNKGRESWKWVDWETKQSTWNDRYIIQ
jgi:hypothetical protein